jgi:hypothetical protein
MASFLLPPVLNRPDQGGICGPELGRQQEPVSIALDNQAGQPASRKSPGVDIDAIRQDLRLRHRGVAMDDDFSKILGAGEELVADPQQILAGLTAERNTRPDPGVAQEIIPDGHRKPQRGEETHMQLRDGLAQRLGGPLEAFAHHEVAYRYSVGMQRLQATQMPPVAADGRVVQEGLEQALVVAPERDVGRREWILGEPIEHAAGLGSAIDVVAQRNRQTIGGGLRTYVSMDLIDGPVEQVQPAVNVADDVKTSVAG